VPLDGLLRIDLEVRRGDLPEPPPGGTDTNGENSAHGAGDESSTAGSSDANGAGAAPAAATAALAAVTGAARRGPEVR
jgi:hypothetical protein